MNVELLGKLEMSPVIAAVKDRNFEEAINSPAEVIFLLGGNIMNVEERIKAAHNKGKYIFIHIDLTDGIGKDRAGIAFLASLKCDGIISTKASIIRMAKENGLITVQRFFAYDSQGVDGINDILANSNPDIIEIMPGVIGKIIERFANSSIPLISGGLIETKAEVTAALGLGAFAVSTGKAELWYM